MGNKREKKQQDKKGKKKGRKTSDLETKVNEESIVYYADLEKKTVKDEKGEK